MRPDTVPGKTRLAIPEQLRADLLPVVKKVFWWGAPADWLHDTIRFVAQVMTYGDWRDTVLVARL